MTRRHPSRRLTRFRLLLGCLLALGTAALGAGQRSPAPQLPLVIAAHH